MKVGFLFNHEALHQINHSAPIIVELLRYSRVGVTVLTSTLEQETAVRSLLGGESAGVDFVRLAIGRTARGLDATLNWVVPFRRIAVLRENLAAFAALDVLVVPETTSLLLRDRFGLRDLKMVWIPHGAGDRSVGYRSVMRGFDLVLLSGPKVRDRMLTAKLITPATHEIIGYPKFDAIDADAPLPQLFEQDRPTVLYNPHFEPRLSSWYTMGEQIVEWFAQQDRYNLIVSPHVMLFQRRLHASVEHRQMRWRRALPEHLLHLPNVLVDTGSARSVDMTYTRSADIYLGDVSSQIYEWIVRPRPAIFLNPLHVDWVGNPDFAHWRLGAVVDQVAHLPEALDHATAHPGQYRSAQEQALRDTFDVTDRSASSRAAEAIVRRFC